VIFSILLLHALRALPARTGRKKAMRAVLMTDGLYERSGFGVASQTDRRD